MCLSVYFIDSSFVEAFKQCNQSGKYVGRVWEGCRKGVGRVWEVCQKGFVKDMGRGKSQA